MTPRIRVAALAVLTVALCMIAGVALAAETATAAPDSVPLVPGAVEVQLWPGAQSGTTVLLVSTEVSSSVALPVRVRIPLPEEFELQWAGEISMTGGEDVERDPVLGKTEHGAYVEFILTGSRVGQIDATGRLYAGEGGASTARMGWVQSVEAESVSFSVRIPAGATGLAIEPEPQGSPAVGEEGDLLYALGAGKPDAGDAQYVSVSFIPAGDEVPKSGAAPTLVVLGVLLAAVLLVVVFALFRVKRTTRD